MTTSVVVPLSDIDNTVLIPICKSIISTLMFSTNVQLDTQSVVMKPRGGEAFQQQTSNSVDTLQLKSKPHIEFEYKEMDHPTEFHFNKYQAYEFPSVFSHPNLGIQITPIYNRVKLEINITYHHPNWNAIKSWIRLMKIRNLKENPDSYHNIFYHFIVPEDVCAYLTAAHLLSENVAGYGMSLTDFLRIYSNECFGNITNLTGTNRDLIVNVKNSNVFGMFTNELPDEPDTSHETSTSSVEFTFELTFDSPVAVLLDYQKYIHNQELDTSFLLKYADRRNHSDPFSGTLTYSQAINQFSNNFNQYFTADLNNNGLQLVQVNKDTVNNQPTDLNLTNLSDGWTPEVRPRYMASITTFPIQLDPNNMNEIMDLHHLVSLGFPEWMVGLFEQFYMKMTSAYAWVFYVELYAVNSEVIRVPISIDRNLIVRSLADMNLRNRHYIRILVNTDLMNIDLSSLQRQPEVLTQMLRYINPSINLETVGGGQFVTNQSLFNAKKQIKNLVRDGTMDHTVQYSGIRVMRNKS